MKGPQHCFSNHLLIHNGYGVKSSQSLPQQNYKLNMTKNKLKQTTNTFYFVVNFTRSHIITINAKIKKFSFIIF